MINKNAQYLKTQNFIVKISILIFISTLFIINLMEDTTFIFYKIKIITTKNFIIYDTIPINFIISFDPINFFLILLTNFIFTICYLVISTYRNKKQKNNILFYILMLHIIVLFAFCCLNILLFYIFLELTLIPMFLLINKWSIRPKKIKAAYYLFYYTLVSSFFMLVALITMNLITNTFAYQSIQFFSFNKKQEIFLWICFFITFATKIPIIPFHLWLPQAHVEAQTVGSIILASLLLKLGGYGCLRFIINIFKEANLYYTPLTTSLMVISILYSSLAAIRQVDIKRLIAYSSIAHMNIAMLGLFITSTLGISGNYYLLVGHGFVSSLLFFSIGILYDRYHTRIIFYYGGLTQIMPVFAFFLFFASLANIAFPATINFVSEFLILLGLIQENWLIILFLGSGIILAGVYSIGLFNKLMFGTLNINYIKFFTDLNKREIFIALSFSSPCILLGINADLIIKKILMFSLI